MSQLSSQIHTIKRGNKNKMRKYSLLAFSNSKSIAWSLKKWTIFFRNKNEEVFLGSASLDGYVLCNLFFKLQLGSKWMRQGLLRPANEWTNG